MHSDVILKKQYFWSEDKKVKQSDYRPRGFQEVEASGFKDSRHIMVVRLSALRTGHLYPREIFVVGYSILLEAEPIPKP
jgi:hypothetical protein